MVVPPIFIFEIPVGLSERTLDFSGYLNDKAIFLNRAIHYLYEGTMCTG